MKKLVTFLATFTLSVLMSIPVLAEPSSAYKFDSTVHLAPPTNTLKAEYDAQVANYENLMHNAEFSQYYISTQPIDALNLKRSTTLTDPIMEAYLDDDGINVPVWNLPILKQPYFYVLEANDYLVMPDYTYPVLVLKSTAPSSTVNVTLTIYERTAYGRNEVQNATLSLSSAITLPPATNIKMDDSGSLTVAKNGLDNKTWQFEYRGWFYPYETRDAVFCEDLVIANDITYTNPELYSLANNYTLSHADVGTQQASHITGYSFSKTTYDGMLPMSTSVGTDVATQDVHGWYGNELKVADSATLKLLTYSLGPKQDIDLSTNVFNHSSQRVKFKNNSYELTNGATWAFFTPVGCHVCEVPAQAISNIYDNMNAPPFLECTDLTVGTPYTIRSIANDYTYGIPVDVATAETESLKYEISENDNGETVIKLLEELEHDHNLAAVSFWNAYKPSVGAFGSGDEKHYTLKFDSRGGTPQDDLYVTMGLPTTGAPNPDESRKPTRNDYTFQGWYTEPECKTKYNYNTFAATPSGVYTLYAKWELVTGDYTVVFIDGVNGTKTTRTFNTANQPELPESPSATGYKFKNWQIVANETATAGTDYNPVTFKPTIGTTYYFRANWDVTGIITNVSVTKSTYYVGEEINRDYIKVTVQTDANGTTRILSPNEFTITPTALGSEGLQQVTLRYSQTGATAIINLTGLADTLSSIAAQYTGGSLAVGAKIPTTNVRVTGTYASGKTTTLTSFSISPSTVTAVGDNKVTVTSGGLSTTMTVVGKSSGSGSGSSDSGTTIRTITASYTGGSIYVGDYLDTSKFTVTAFYNDGTSKKVSDGQYTISPRTMKNAGMQTVTIGYSGFTTTLQLNVLDRAYSGSSSSAGSGSTITTGGRDYTYDGRPGASSGTTVTNPDGSTTTYNPDGTITTTSPSSSTTTTTTKTTNGQNVGDKITSEPLRDADGNIITGALDDETLLALGGRPLADADNKNISKYYLNGKWVMDVFPNDQEIVSDSTSLLDELKSIEPHADSQVIYRTNGGNNNNFGSNEIKYVKSNLKPEIQLIIKMVKDQTSRQEIAEWTLNGNNMPANPTDEDNIMLNVAVTQFERTDDEIIIGVGTNMSSIPAWATLKVDTQKYFPTVTRTRTKAYDAKFTSQASYIDGTFRNKSTEPEDYVVSDAVILDNTTRTGSKVFTTHLDDIYEYDTYFEQQPVWTSSAPRSSGTTEVDESEDDGWEDDWDNTDPSTADEGKKSIPSWLFFVIGGIVIAGGGAAAFVIIRSHRTPDLPVTEGEPDFPENTDDYDEEEYPEEYYDEDATEDYSDDEDDF